MSLPVKIAEMIQQVQQPHQSGQHPHKRFKYSTRDDLFAVLRGLCASRGIVIVPSVELVSLERVHDTNKGAAQYRAVVKLHVTVTDGKDELRSQWVGESYSTDETAIQSAATQAMRFFLINTFMLFDGEGEVDYSAATPGEQTKQVPAPPKPNEAVAELEQLLQRAGLEAQEVVAFLAWIAEQESKRAIGQVAPERLKLWVSKLSARGASLADEARRRI